MSFLGPLNLFCATLLLRGMKLVVAGSSAGTRLWKVPARQLCREHRGVAGDSQHPCERQELFDFYGFNLFKNPRQSAAGGKNQKTRPLLGEMLKDHMN